ncbi:unnamed protein product [Tuber aestivum]|uniref:Uncharacterized protein n=1 Tax=Tuber aestivum TaxID=59557 RepID=A0A292Q1C6_9PEZI|nr:unnamed protein product [Tuber aestivum]
MVRTHIETVRTGKLPKHITEIGMSAEQYYHLKVYIKGIILPGTPAFDSNPFDSKDIIYRQWLKIALEKIGPKFFQKGQNKLVWPEDSYGISNAVHQVVRNFSFKIKKKYKTAGLRAPRSRAEGGKAEMAQDGKHGEGGGSDTDVAEDATRADTDVAEDATRADQEVGLEMDTADIEFKYLLSLMKPEAFTQFPDLDDECFNWDEVEDSNTQDSVRHLANLDQ